MNRTFKRLRAFGSKLRKDVSGNTMIMVALGMPMLVGGTGLAVDTAQWYLWQRELQYAVDQAAMSGAYSLSKADNPAPVSGMPGLGQSFRTTRTLSILKPMSMSA